MFNLTVEHEGDNKESPVGSILVRLSESALRGIARAIAADIASSTRRYCRIYNVATGECLYTVSSGAWTEGHVPIGGLR